MIISLEDAKKIYPDATQEDLNGIEKSIRMLTNNPFQNRKVRFKQIRFENETTIAVLGDIQGLRAEDTIQVSGSKWNDGLYVVDAIDGQLINLEGNPRLFMGTDPDAFLTKVEYPADILSGVRKLLTYDAKMRDKVGLKSKTVSRMSETYYDQNSGESVNGYPAALMSFINKYKLLKW
ncbi:hypothetical protein [Enterococcus gallinarum]|uniref:hypothetical protein n=1 Tax=Enterococcus gallinarum TaxID=1353 RepID=UPI001F583B17|nr:hypothetical protein [Enterococcus gallinarum]